MAYFGAFAMLENFWPIKILRHGHIFWSNGVFEHYGLIKFKEFTKFLINIYIISLLIFNFIFIFLKFAKNLTFKLIAFIKNYNFIFNIRLI